MIKTYTGKLLLYEHRCKGRTLQIKKSSFYSSALLFSGYESALVPEGPGRFPEVFPEGKILLGRQRQGHFFRPPFLENGAATFARKSRKVTGSVPEGKISFVSVGRLMSFFSLLFRRVPTPLQPEAQTAAVRKVPEDSRKYSRKRVIK